MSFNIQENILKYDRIDSQIKSLKKQIEPIQQEIRSLTKEKNELKDSLIVKKL